MRLFYNELQYPTSPKVNEVFEWFAKNPQELAFYYDGDGMDLCQAIATKYGVKKENVRVDNGSDAVLAIIFQTFLVGKVVAIPELSYGLYKTWADYYKVNVKYIPLLENFDINFQDYRGFDAVLVANPNAQTGVVKSFDEIKSFVKENKDTLVIVDEAYIVFSDEQSVASLVGEFENLLVVQTFSKSYGLANLRVGYVFGCEKLIEKFKNTQQATIEYPLSQIDQMSALAAIEDTKYFDCIISKIKQTRKWFTAQMRELGFGVTDSHANYVLVKCDDAKGLFEYLKKNNILVRHLEIPIIMDYLRITIGTDKQMEKVVECVRNYVG